MPRLLVSLEDGVKRITFNAPERRNAVDRETMERFCEAVREAAADESRVVILTGAADAFCSGADLQGPALGTAAESVEAFLRRVATPAVLALREMEKPVIARVHGAAAGIGASYALAADLRIASTLARFSLAFVKIGLVPDGGATWLLPRLVGYAKAYELMATGEAIDAREALRLGLVNQVVAPEDLDAAVEGWAGKLKSGPARALAGIKKALRYGEGHGLEESLELEAGLQQGCFESADFREGLAAFREKRAARFGR